MHAEGRTAEETQESKPTVEHW